MEHSQYIEILKVLGTIVTGIILGIIGTVMKTVSKKDDYVTHEFYSCEKDKIYNDVDKKITLARNEMATKESVENLKEGFIDLKKNVEQKFDNFEKTLHEMSINVAILAERRKESR